MKKILTYLSILTAAFLFTPNTAEAQYCSGGTTTYISGYTSCGSPIYTQRIIVRYDCYGRPVYTYRTLPVVYRQPEVQYNYRSNYRPAPHYTSYRGYNSYNDNSCNNNSGYNNNYHSNGYNNNSCQSNGYYNGGTRLRVTYSR